MSGRLRLGCSLCIALLVFAFDSAAFGQRTETEEEIVGAELTASPMSVSPGDKFTLTVKLKLRDGAHANSNMPDDPYLIPTIFTPGKTEGIVWESINYPKPTKVVETYSINPLSVFEDGAEISIQAMVGQEVKGEVITLGGVLRVQACDREQCYPPKNLPLEVSIKLDSKTPSPSANKEKLATAASPRSESIATDRAVDKSIDFDFVDFEGTKRKLSEFRGKYVLLDFWATWCAPCLADIPKLKKLYGTFKSGGFEIIGMDSETIGDDGEAPDPEFAKETAARAKQIVATRGVTWTQATTETAVPVAIKVFGVRALPTKILINREGKIIATIGEKEDLEGIVSKLISSEKK